VRDSSAVVQLLFNFCSAALPFFSPSSSAVVQLFSRFPPAFAQLQNLQRQQTTISEWFNFLFPQAPTQIFYFTWVEVTQFQVEKIQFFIYAQHTHYVLGQEEGYAAGIRCLRKLTQTK